MSLGILCHSPFSLWLIIIGLFFSLSVCLCVCVPANRVLCTHNQYHNGWPESRSLSDRSTVCVGWISPWTTRASISFSTMSGNVMWTRLGALSLWISKLATDLFTDMLRARGRNTISHFHLYICSAEVWFHVYATSGLPICQSFLNMCCRIFGVLLSVQFALNNWKSIFLSYALLQGKHQQASKCVCV